MLGFDDIEAISRVHGDDFYLFDKAKFTFNFERLRGAFRNIYPRTEIGYSYKTNYTPYVCALVDRLGGFAEVVSEMEYALARRLGVDGKRIIYNGPYKSADSFADALKQGAIVNLDSRRDLGLLFDIVRNHGPARFGVVLRCNFSRGAAGTSRFGFDTNGEAFREAVAAITQSDAVYLAGLHCHLPDRDIASFTARVSKLIALSKQLFPDAPPEYLNIGGGFFGSLPESLVAARGLTPVSFREYAEAVAPIVCDAYPHEGQRPLLFLEPGTALVADTFSFCAKVLDTKVVEGQNVATIAGSLFNVSPNAKAADLPVRALRGSDDEGAATGKTRFDIAGYTCIEGDILTRGFEGTLRPGDFVEYSNVGSYSVVMKPPFILPNAPILTHDKATGETLVIKRRETVDDIFHTFAGWDDGSDPDHQ